jgi:hypothetical protein
MTTLDKNTRDIIAAVTAKLTAAHTASAPTIDLGSGQGWLLQALAECGLTDLTGVGFDTPAAPTRRVIAEIDLCRDGWAERCGVGRYRFVIATEVIEHLK